MILVVDETAARTGGEAGEAGANAADAAIDALVAHYRASRLEDEAADETIVVTSSSVREVDPRFASLVRRSVVFDSDIQLASRRWKDRRVVDVAGVPIGTGDATAVIAGPCSVESEEQIRRTAAFLKGLGAGFLRAGAYKPRTSPYSFQGLGDAGLELLRRTCDEFDLRLVTEVRDATHVDAVLEAADIVQVGAKAMYDHGILRAAGASRKPVLLKRGFGSTLQELVQAAEFVLSGGNPNVALCERGIRTFESKSRFTLDLCGVAWLKRHVNLPIVVDPSHAMGHAYGVADLARASLAMGIDGLLLEVHPDPASARSDASQQLDFAAFEALRESLRPVATAVGRRLA